MSWFSDKRLSTTRMAVVPHSPARRVAAVAALAVVGFVLVLGAFWFGRMQSGLDLAELDRLEHALLESRAEVDALNRQLVDSRLGQDVDRQAGVVLQGTIKELRDEVADLNKEVTLYKSLMAPSSLERGLQIADFELSPGDEPATFQYRLLLTQVARNRTWVEGRVEVRVEGVGAGAEAGNGVAGNGGERELVLSLTELGHTEPYPLVYRFRYFQDLAGLLVLPPGFTPIRIHVNARPKGGGKMLERSFDWLLVEE